MPKLRSRPGYTLLELLVSIAIFSGVMIMALGAFARSANSTAVSNVSREKAEAARSLIDQISNDFRYISTDAAPPGCPAASKGFCVNPAAFVSVPSSVSMLLKFPGQDTYVVKSYYVTNSPHTVRQIESRGCQLAALNLCQPLVANSNTILDSKYLLEGDSVLGQAVFSGRAETANDSGYLGINLVLQPKTATDCDAAGTCFELTTTLVPGAI